jgi:hypothetical protein
MTAVHQEASALAAEPSLPYRLPQELYADEPQSRGEHSTVPHGFPSHVNTPSTWKGTDVQDAEDRWVVELSTAEVDAVNAAVSHFIGVLTCCTYAVEADQRDPQTPDCPYKTFLSTPFLCTGTSPRSWTTLARSATMGSASASCVAWAQKNPKRRRQSCSPAFLLT